MMDKVKATRAKMCIKEILEDVGKDDFESPPATEHLKNLAKLYGFYDAECMKEEFSDSSMRGMGRSMMSDDGRGGMGQDYSMRQQRAPNGQFMSGADGASYANYSYGNSKEQMMQMINDPSLSYEAKEYLRKAMAHMR